MVSYFEENYDPEPGDDDGTDDELSVSVSCKYEYTNFLSLPYFLCRPPKAKN